MSNLRLACSKLKYVYDRKLNAAAWSDTSEELNQIDLKKYFNVVNLHRDEFWYEIYDYQVVWSAGIYFLELYAIAFVISMKNMKKTLIENIEKERRNIDKTLKTMRKHCANVWFIISVYQQIYRKRDWIHWNNSLKIT